MRICYCEQVQALKQNIQDQISIQERLQNLIYAVKSMKEEFKLHDYGIGSDSTIILNSILLGRCLGSSTKDPISFKYAVKGKAEPQNQPSTLPPFLVPISWSR